MLYPSFEVPMLIQIKILENFKVDILSQLGRRISNVVRCSGSQPFPSGF